MMKKLSLKEAGMVPKVNPQAVGAIGKQIWSLLKQLEQIASQSPTAASYVFELLDILDITVEQTDDKIVKFWEDRGVSIEEIKDTTR